MRVTCPAAALWLLAVGAPASAHPIACGQTVDLGGATLVLEDDLHCPDDPFDGPSLRVVGPGTLDLAGHTIACDDPTDDGIWIEGRRARISGGAVRGCRDGVVLSGGGAHEVRGVSAAGCAGDGFVVESDGNSLRNATATLCDEGFAILGHGNTVRDCLATRNENGFFVAAGARGNALGRNTATTNFVDGFSISGQQGRVLENTSFANSGDGYFVFGEDNELGGNRATGNGDDGIDAGRFGDLAGRDNELHDNTATGNRSYDLSDHDGTCANRWRKNSFATSAAAEVAGAPCLSSHGDAGASGLEGEAPPSGSGVRIRDRD